MTPRTRQRLWSGAAGLLVLAAFALVPSRSEASCGDHVRITTPSSDAVTPPPAPKPPCPCKGPECSSHPDPTPLVPPSPPPTHDARDALVVGHVAADGVPSAAFREPEHSPRPVRYLALILRPPRA